MPQGDLATPVGKGANPGRARINVLSITRLLPASGRQPHLRWLAMNGRRGENQSDNFMFSGSFIRARPGRGSV